MSTFLPFNSIRKIGALVAVTSVLPALAYLAYAGNEKDKGDKGDKGNKVEQKGRGQIEAVPEGGPGIVVLTATFGAILIFSARHLLRGKATE